ncbi:fungal pheromone STE3G-protein-coupled receptor, partial [Peniophora sp. CONT]
MGPADPSYPLYPIANIISSVMLLLVLMTSFVRQSWNLGVAFLCFWLFFENVTSAVNAIVWSANADIKLYVYCDIVTHLQVITYIVKPMGTLIITRRLHLIASLQSVELPSKSRHWDRAVEWTLGLIIPILVAGPIYFVNQGARFEVAGGLGCTTTPQTSILEILVFESWTIIPPLVSILFYYPKVAYTYYRQRRDIHSFLHSSPSVSRTNYLRILILASIDILLTLPISIVNLTLGIVETYSSIGHIPLYPGWTFLHADWEPPSLSYNELQASGTAQLARSYFTEWTSPILAFTIFALFGLTSEARASYMRLMYSVCGRFGW